MMIDIIYTESLGAQEIMDKDFDLLRQLSKSAKPILHFYKWKRPSITYGYFEKPFDLLNESGVKKGGYDLAKRPTGGGIIFHYCDFAFSVLIPASHSVYSVNTLDNYAYINRLVASAIQLFCGKNLELLDRESESDDLNRHFCMGKPTVFDIMIEGKKVSGGAQRRKKNGFLHQASISLTLPTDDELKQLLVHTDHVSDAIKQNSYPILGSDGNLEQTRIDLQSLLIQEFTKAQEVSTRHHRSQSK